VATHDPTQTYPEAGQLSRKGNHLALSLAQKPQAIPKQAGLKPVQFEQATGAIREVDRQEALSKKRRKLKEFQNRIQQEGILGSEQFCRYLGSQYRRNCKFQTIRTSFSQIRYFLLFLQSTGRKSLKDISRDDIAAYIEHEQNRGCMPATVRNKLGSVHAFCAFLIRSGEIPSEVLLRKLCVKVPDSLPKAMEPEDVRALLSVIEPSRDRAMIYVLLRTGMRIGELLQTRVRDVVLMDRKILIFEAEKTGAGRVVYLCEDAMEALSAWLKVRDPSKAYLFYAQGRQSMCYSTARDIFFAGLKKAGLEHKGYHLHCLRHTFASELLNAGMRLECLQQLLGHTSILVTRRYARLTDKTREEEYFRAMECIQKGEVNGHYRLDH